MFSISSRRYPERIVATPVVPALRPIRIGLALGGGAARGWAHIGILRELAAHGIIPDIIAGTSIGAVVGASYAADKLDQLEAFALRLNRRRMIRLMDISFAGAGLISGARLKRQLDKDLGGITIEALGRTFAAVATELGTGREICLTRGDLVEAIRASYALPGLFQPIQVGGRWLFDGAMSNPVPVSVARALGADLVIAVNLTSDVGAPVGVAPVDTMADPSVAELDDLTDAIALDETETPMRQPAVRKRRPLLRRKIFGRRPRGTPGIAGVMVGAFSIAQERISRSRLAIDPPEVLINARLTSVGLFDFHRAADLIEHGRLCCRRAIPKIEARLAARSTTAGQS